jgi:hypothetical protein
MQPSNLSAITFDKYGFKVFDWDDNRGGTDGAGTILLGKIEFKKNPDIKYIADCTKSQITIENRDLTGITDQEIAAIFSKIIERFQNIKINDNTYRPTSIHARGSLQREPFLFILGDLVKQSY